MYGREQCVLLRHYLERGLTKAEVARELGVSRRALYNWIAAGQLDRELDEAPVRYSPRPPVARKLDPFRGIVEARLNEFPRLTADPSVRRDPCRGLCGGRSHGCGADRSGPASLPPDQHPRQQLSNACPRRSPPQFLKLPAIRPLPAATFTRQLALIEEASEGANEEGEEVEGPVEALLGTVAAGVWTERKWTDPVTENPAVGATEVWEIYNTTADAHPCTSTKLPSRS